MDLVIGGVMMVFSFGLLIISILSYREYRNNKLLLVSIVFFLFFVKGLVGAMSIFLESVPRLSPFPYSGLIDLTMLVLLYIATLKR